MNNMFSAGELAKLQHISKQTLLYYDKIGLFKPCYIDPTNDYRYYSAEQLDYLDTILIMKKIGFSLRDIQEKLQHYTTENSILSFEQQLVVIQQKIKDLSLIQSRLERRCLQVRQACELRETEPVLTTIDKVYLLYHSVDAPYSSKDISVATKECYAQALNEDIPIFFECGVSVPLERVQSGRCIEAGTAFLTTEDFPSVSNILCLPQGLTASIYHFGPYASISESYRKLLSYCSEQNLRICSDSYEFCINDYITSKYEDEFITKIMFYVEPM